MDQQNFFTDLWSTIIISEVEKVELSLNYHSSLSLYVGTHHVKIQKHNLKTHKSGYTSTWYKIVPQLKMFYVSVWSPSARPLLTVSAVVPQWVNTGVPSTPAGTRGQCCSFPTIPLLSRWRRRILLPFAVSCCYSRRTSIVFSARTVSFVQ